MFRMFFETQCSSFMQMHADNEMQRNAVIHSNNVWY